MNDTGHEQTTHVPSIELFFDLVFVFVITQVTLLVEEAHTMGDILLVLLVLVPVWWMYAAFSWLTNNAGESTFLRLVLIGAMAGFLVMAIAIPDVFRDGALAFGLAYLFVVILHISAFAWLGRHGAARAILAAMPINLGAAALLIGSALMGRQWQGPLLATTTLLFVIQMIRMVSAHEQRFALSSGHFAERHRLIVIIALGESIVAIALGIGNNSHIAEFGGLLGLALALALVAALWWSYFDREDQRAEDHFLSAAPDMRTRMALLGYWCGHLVLLFGIILVSAGVKELLDTTHSATSAHARWLLSAGIAVFMAGEMIFRAILGIRPLLNKLVAALLALVLGFIGATWSPMVFLAVATALAIGAAMAERQFQVR